MNNWISVKEKLPSDYEEVLYLAINELGIKEIMTGHREKGLWTHCCFFYSTVILTELITVTHWIPFPRYPEQDK